MQEADLPTHCKGDRYVGILLNQHLEAQFVATCGDDKRKKHRLLFLISHYLEIDHDFPSRNIQPE